MESEKPSLSEELLKETIEKTLSKINSCENPEELEAIKKTIRRNVPFTRRGYFSAMLLKELLSSSKGEKKERREKSPVKETPKEKESVKKEEKKSLPEGAKTLYLNIGKMKHLYAKDLSLLLQKEIGVKREDIYSLHVHDKYSFITMSEENCGKAIAALNGKEINGRTAQINFSNK